MANELEKIKELENELLKIRLTIQELERGKEQYNKRANVISFVWGFSIIGLFLFTASQGEGNRTLPLIFTWIVVAFFLIWLVNAWINYANFGKKFNFAKKKKKTARKWNKRLGLFSESEGQKRKRVKLISQIFLYKSISKSNYD